MRVFIGCSAKEVINKDYYKLAVDVSTMLAKRGHKLVFGGAELGMMGKCYLTFRYEEQPVKGIAVLRDADDMAKLDLAAQEVTPTIFRRTEEIYKSSDVLIILPGGFGTYTELFSFIDEKRTKGDKKPIIIYNFNDYYTPLLEFIRKGYKEGFIDESFRKMRKKK